MREIMMINKYLTAKLQVFKQFLRNKKNGVKDWYSKTFKPLVKNTYVLIISIIEIIPLDFIFVFLASFILTQDYSLMQRLGFSIGLSYIYRLIVKDVHENSRIKSNNR